MIVHEPLESHVELWTIHRHFASSHRLSWEMSHISSLVSVTVSAIGSARWRLDRQTVSTWPVVCTSRPPAQSVDCLAARGDRSVRRSSHQDTYIILWRAQRRRSAERERTFGIHDVGDRHGGEHVLMRLEGPAISDWTVIGLSMWCGVQSWCAWAASASVERCGLNIVFRAERTVGASSESDKHRDGLRWIVDRCGTTGVVSVVTVECRTVSVCMTRYSCVLTTSVAWS